MTVLYRDPIFLEHDTADHPERAERLTAIDAAIAAANLDTQCGRGRITRPVNPSDLLMAHNASVFRKATELATAGGGRIDADTVVSPRSVEVATTAVAAAFSAVDQVMKTKDHTALCLVRPPGHHATSNQSMGFCLFNTIALAASYAEAMYNMERILIIDFDVHHGNGTQDIFYTDPNIFFFSIHRYGHGFYPGTGLADETGEDKGRGATLNLPLPAYTPRAEYLTRFRSALDAAARASRPQIVLVSAGFDGHRLDPIGGLNLETEDYATITRSICEVADQYCSGRVVSLLEGGYHLRATGESVVAHLSELMRL